MDVLLARKRGNSQVDKRHDKSNKGCHTQRTDVCGAEMTRTGEFTEGLESRRAHWELMGEAHRLVPNNSMKMSLIPVKNHTQRSRNHRLWKAWSCGFKSGSAIRYSYSGDNTDISGVFSVKGENKCEIPGTQ